MKVSIITVSYNSYDTIYYAMQSVLSQYYKNIEYIIIDGASTDKTTNMIKRMEKHFEGRLTWISESDNGIYDAMNKGIALATGDVIGILNSDDRFKNRQTIDLVMSYFKDKKCDAVFGDIEFVSRDNLYKTIRYWKCSPYIEGSFKKGWHPPHPSFFVKKDVYEKHGKFDTSFDVSADFELMLRFIEKKQIKAEYIPQTLVSMRYGGESTGSVNKIIKGNLNIIKAFKKNEIPVNPVMYITNRIIKKIKQFEKIETDF